MGEEESYRGMEAGSSLGVQALERQLSTCFIAPLPSLFLELTHSVLFYDHLGTRMPGSFLIAIESSGDSLPHPLTLSSLSNKNQL